MGTGDLKIKSNGANKRERAKEARGRRASQSGQFEITPRHWAYLAALGNAFMRTGGALRIGKTRDGGALALGCYAGDDYATEYIKPHENFEDAIYEIAEAWCEEGLAVLEAELKKIAPDA